MPLGLRSMSNDEKKAVADVGPVFELKRDGGVNNIDRFFLAELGEQIDKFAKKFEPFCTKCAIREFQREVENKERFMKEYQGDITKIKDQITIKIKNRDFEKYGKARFKKIRDVAVHEKRLDGGMKVDYHTGWNVDYVCNICGAGVTVVVPTKKTQNIEALPEEYDLGTKKKSIIKSNTVPNSSKTDSEKTNSSIETI